jgi:hypothetical protein
MPNESCTVSASIYDLTDRPAAGIAVTIVPAGYLAPLSAALNKTQRKIASATTNDSGSFTIDSLDSGSYVIEANDDKISACLIRCAVAPGDTAKKLGVFTLKQFAAVVGSVDTTGTSGKKRYVQVYGLDRIVPVQSNGSFVIDSIPADTFRLRILCTDSSLVPPVFCTAQTTPAETTTVLTGWSLSKRVVFNTTASGADVSGNVFHFPVLIRLTSSNFDFGQAKAGGDDLRFAKSNGTPLSYEIERWDASQGSAQGSAEIWVNVDTIYGHDSSHFITMYWGNPNAVSESNGAAAFDTADGFKAVYHLNDANDATYDNDNGTKYGVTDTVGIIGGAQEFHGTDTIVIPSRMGMPASVTISAWANLSKRDSVGAEVVSISDATAIRMDDKGSSAANAGTRGGYHYGSNCSDYSITNSGQFFVQTGWHYLAYAFDNVNHEQNLYIDGVLSVSTSYNQSVYYSPLGKSTYLGVHGNDWGCRQSGFSFTGAIDEVRVCGLARSADWIKLCYMNQKAVDALIVFK